MCCAEFIVKYVLFFFNLVFALAGIGLIGVGIAVLVGVQEILELIPYNLNTIPVAVIVAGSIIFVISFSGCCGAIRESRCLLVGYAIFMLILAAAKIYLAVVLSRNLDTIPTTVRGWVEDAFDKNLDNIGRFQVLEVAFSCCGTTGADSYEPLGFIPPSCCREPVNNVCSAASSFGGCSERLSDYFTTYSEVVSIAIIVIIVIELIAMIFALYMNHTITEKSRQKY